MAVFETGTLSLPDDFSREFITKVRDRSTVTRLAPETSFQSLRNTEYELITAEPEAEVIKESQPKSQMDMTLGKVITGTHKAVVTMRYSDEALKLADDEALALVRESGDMMAAACSRAIDYVIYHAVSPKGAVPIDGVTSLVSAANQQVATADMQEDIDALPDLIVTAGYDFNGIAAAVSFANDLRKVRNSEGMRLFPEVPLNPRDTGDIAGINTAVSTTVNGALITPATGVMAIGGDFSRIKWGIVQEIPTKLIEYGDPDNTGQDLQGYNQVALRYEIMFKYAILDPKAFTVLKAS